MYYNPGSLPLLKQSWKLPLASRMENKSTVSLKLRQVGWGMDWCAQGAYCIKIVFRILIRFVFSQTICLFS